MANVPGVFEIDIDDDKNPGLGYSHGGLGGQYSQNGGPGGGSGAGSCAQDGEHAINLDIEIQVNIVLLQWTDTYQIIIDMESVLIRNL